MRTLAILALLSATVFAQSLIPDIDHVNVHAVLHEQYLLEQSGNGTSNTDEAIVTKAFGSLPVNMENLKAFVSARGLSDVGLIDDLITDAACIITLEEDTPGVKLTIATLQQYLSDRELSTAGNKDELFERSCAYNQQEVAVETLMGKTIGDITKDELKAQLASLGFISTSGSKPELVSRLGNVFKNIATIKKLLNDPNFQTFSVKALLAARGLSTDGQTDEMLDRLADYLVDNAQNTMMPGISPHCDMVLESSVCIAGGVKVVNRDAAPRALVARYTFDDAHMVDSSGNANHVADVGSFGPGLNGIGQSVKFDGNSSIMIPHNDAFNSKEQSVSFWLYLLEDSIGQWRTVLHKGARDHERTPSLFLEPLTRGIELFVSTSNDEFPSGERLWSNTFIPLRRWTHIAFNVEGRNLRLYINGILDAENTTIGTPIFNKGPIYVGNDPWRPAGGVNGFIDELHYYSRVLTVDEIQAAAETSLGLVEPSFVELGCLACSLDNCPKTCRKGYRMCTQRDLYAGGYFVARNMGWTAPDTTIWSAEDGMKGTGSATASGLCMCCRIAA